MGDFIPGKLVYDTTDGLVTVVNQDFTGCRRAAAQRAMESALGGAAVMKTGNDFLSGVTALGKAYRLIQVKIQILRQVLANSLCLDPCACRAQFLPCKLC
jgi:hypothetical protein